jgi:lipoprotein-anchoring transpeptidase ErfK/SrfK
VLTAARTPAIVPSDPLVVLLAALLAGRRVASLAASTGCWESILITGTAIYANPAPRRGAQSTASPGPQPRVPCNGVLNRPHNDHPRFGRQNISTAETQPFDVIASPPSADFNTTPPRNTTAQIPRTAPEGGPPTASKAEEHGVISVLPPEDQPEVGPPKLAPQFRRTEVSYQTKEPTGSIIVDIPNTYLYLVRFCSTCWCPATNGRQ